MTKVHAQVMQGAGHFHDQIGKAWFGVAELVFDDATAFHPSDSMFDNNAYTRQQMIQGFVDPAEFLTARLFFGCQATTPDGS